MIYLATPPSARTLPAYEEHCLGVMWTPVMWNRPRREWPVWAIDTGCFSRPDLYENERYIAKLWQLVERMGADDLGTPLFATAPDVLRWRGADGIIRDHRSKGDEAVGFADETLERSAPVLPLIRAVGLRAALVAQDGLQDLVVPWGTFDVLFLGGSTEWKLSDAAHALTDLAHEHGKWVHMGRVNTMKRIFLAASWGIDSVDGTTVSWGAKYIPKIARWMAAANAKYGDQT